ncbi:MAG: IS110 family transposase [Thermoanaerobaculia bacterium]|nr:MAG: IS110 family transposase [Thermoanaerobaculia bacterium]
MAVDLAKSVFEVAVSDRPGRVGERQRLNRPALLPYFAQREPATVLLEACGTAHFWARELEGLGHRVRLLPAQHVRRYRQGNKTDRADAKALLEAFRSEEIRPVPVKTPAQQELTVLHRLRAAWHGTRTARINTLRGLLREQGIAIPAGASRFVSRALELAGDVNSPLGESLRFAAFELVTEIRELERRIAEIERRLEALGRRNPLVQRLRSVPGIGLLTSTAIAGFVGDLRRFPSGRHFASYLGLTPRERSTGGTRRLGAITKRGDVYLRMMLIHGARAVLAAAAQQREPDSVRSWALEASQRLGHNKATVALANKLARFAWATATQERNFETRSKAA